MRVEFAIAMEYKPKICRFGYMLTLNDFSCATPFPCFADSSPFRPLNIRNRFYFIPPSFERKNVLRALPFQQRITTILFSLLRYRHTGYHRPMAGRKKKQLGQLRCIRMTARFRESPKWRMVSICCDH